MSDYGVNYRCKSWQTFIQQVINYACNGYNYYHCYTLPSKRLISISTVDEKIIKFYGTNLSKDKKYRNKLAGNANYAYLRLDGLIVILKTDGKGVSTDQDNENRKFKDFRHVGLMFHPNNGELSVKIEYRDGQYTLCLTKMSYQRIKDKCVDLLIHNKIREFLFTFNALNSIPPYKGVYDQKRRLKQYLMKLVKKHGRSVKSNDLKVTTKVIRYKVYVDDEK